MASTSFGRVILITYDNSAATNRRRLDRNYLYDLRARGVYSWVSAFMVLRYHFLLTYFTTFWDCIEDGRSYFALDGDTPRSMVGEKRNTRWKRSGGFQQLQGSTCTIRSFSTRTHILSIFNSRSQYHPSHITSNVHDLFDTRHTQIPTTTHTKASSTLHCYCTVWPPHWPFDTRGGRYTGTRFQRRIWMIYRMRPDYRGNMTFTIYLDSSYLTVQMQSHLDEIMPDFQFLPSSDGDFSFLQFPLHDFFLFSIPGSHSRVTPPSNPSCSSPMSILPYKSNSILPLLVSCSPCPAESATVDPQPQDLPAFFPFQPQRSAILYLFWVTCGKGDVLPPSDLRGLEGPFCFTRRLAHGMDDLAHNGC